ncbi:hypothetical protein DER45DRAFT_93082 [Fusarium avenaceum]|nr:hypothetical protein DER45DRAFT_93082 [Fusarium avenaceum]
MFTMGTSNVGKTSPTQPVDDDFDASDWAINLNIWSFVPEFDQGFDEWLPADGQGSVQCSGSDHACKSHSVTRQGEQSLPFNAWDVPEPESFDIGIEQILSQDADLGISSTTYDLPLEPPIIEPRFEPFPSESLDLFLRKLTPLPNTDPSPDKIPDTVPQWLDRQVTMDDLKYSHQTGPKPGGSRYISKKEIGFEVGHLHMDDDPAMAQGSLNYGLNPRDLQTRRIAEPSRCAPCRFANIPKAGLPTKSCSFPMLIVD